MEQLHLLFLLSFSMLIGSYFSGIVPLSFKLSSSKSRLLALMGSGILVGTALSIIIPEGIDSIYSPAGNSPPDPILMHHEDVTQPDKSMQQEAPVQKWVIGLSLVIGFILMFLIDQFSLYQAGESVHQAEQSHSHNEYLLASQEDVELFNDNVDIDLNEPEQDKNNLEQLKPPINLNKADSVIDLTNTTNRQNSSTSHTRATNTKMTPTLGLVIHAAADGIALGAAATTTHRQVEMIIFLAIMLHKAPAAFSLVVFLLHRGLKTATIRRHLLAFSLSAPLAALLTYFGLSQSGKEALRRNNTTGIAMLFSAGTFLYVATVHVLPELVHNKLLSQKEMLFLLGGSFLPILLAQTV